VAHQQQLGAAQKEAVAAMESLRMEGTAKEAELQRRIDYARKTAEAEAARIQRRADADMADLRATISRLEVDLMKVRALTYL
jgi:CHASE1-domain containing sensor protein